MIILRQNSYSLDEKKVNLGLASGLTSTGLGAALYLAGKHGKISNKNVVKALKANGILLTALGVPLTAGAAYLKRDMKKEKEKK